MRAPRADRRWAMCALSLGRELTLFQPAGLWNYVNCFV